MDRRFTCDFFDITNPEGVSRKVQEAVRASADRPALSPEGMERKLEQAVSWRYGVPAEYICCGGGTASLLCRLILAFRPAKALVFAPAWSFYEKVLSRSGCQVSIYEAAERTGFHPDQGMREAILQSGADMVLLANPGFPTGTLMDKARLTDLIYLCRKEGIRIVIDECFMEFVVGQEQCSLLTGIADMGEVILLRSFSASHAMQGLRLGFAVCGNPEDARILQGCADDHTVSWPACLAGLAALEEEGPSDRLCVEIAVERERLLAGLLRLGYRAYPSQANFVMFRSGASLDEKLRAMGIRIREVTGSTGLAGLPGYFYLASVRAPEENMRLLDCLKAVARTADRGIGI